MPSSDKLDSLQERLDAHIEAARTTLVLEDFVRHSGQAKLPIRPHFLKEITAGGLRYGDTIMVYGRPGAGKTALAVNIAASLLVQQQTVLYCGNEESRERNGLRFLSLLSNTSLRDLDSADSELSKQAVSSAFEKAQGLNWAGLHFTEQLSLGEILEHILELKPNVVVLDQIRNLDRDNEQTAGLENAMRWLRTVGIKHKAIGIATAQAYAGAEGKEVLGLTDLDSSKTGVQGACDLMVGIGVSEALHAAGRRCISVPRNKLTGIIEHRYVRVDLQHTRILE